MDFEAVIAKAKDQGIKNIVVLDHLWGNNLNERSMPEELIKQRAAIQDKYGQLDIKISAEFNFDEGLVAPDLVPSVDFVTAGVHTLNKFGIFIAAQMHVGLLSAIINKFELTPILDHFIEQTVAMLKHENVLVAAHPLNLYPYLEANGYDCIEHMMENFDKLAPHLADKGFELNSGIFARLENQFAKNSPRRFESVFNCYADVVAKLAPAVGFFTIASDAHRLCDVGDIRWATRLAQAAGIEDRISKPAFFRTSTHKR